MHGPRRVITFCLLTAVLPTVLLVIPLYLRHSVYADVSYEVTESDVLEIVEGISSVFCQAHGLKMNSTFSAFKLDGEPKISDNRKYIHLKKSMSLPDDTLEYWGFYLLKGSKVVVTVCSRYDGGRVMLVRGERNLKTCGLLQHNSRQRIQQQEGIGGKEQTEENNFHMVFEKKQERKPEGSVRSPEVDGGGSRRVSGRQKALPEHEGETDPAMEEVGMVHVDEGGEEGWGKTAGEPELEKRVRPSLGGNAGAKQNLKRKLKKQKIEDDIDDDDDDDIDDDEDDDDIDDDEDDDDEDEHDEDDDDDEERSGQGDIEALHLDEGIKRHPKQKSGSYLGNDSEGGGTDTSGHPSEVIRHKKKLKKLGLLKERDFDGLGTKTRRRRSSRYLRESRVGRLERLSRDLAKEEDGDGGERAKRRQKREDVRLVDTGLKHGGNAIGYIKRESAEDSDSSFELGLKECYGGLIEHQRSFQPSETCTEDVASDSMDINGGEESKNSLRFAYDIVESGYYYYIFYSDNDIVTNTMHATFDIQKAVYEYGSENGGNSSEKCVNATECTFSVGFLSGATVMVEIPHRDGIDRDVMDEIGGPQGALLISSCHPRMSVYIVFPIAVLFLILGCAFL
ncbi:uncharacterized protein LOC124168517 isoform X2 [Ischnura elegans]|nr:uncharacterized protein LOC124168517 isoform X2 [Ischnura elegans]